MTSTEIQVLSLIVSILVIVGSVAGSFMGVKKGLNGQKETLKEVKEDIKSMKKDFGEKLDGIKEQTLENKNQIQNQRAVCNERKEQLEDIRRKQNE